MNTVQPYLEDDAARLAICSVGQRMYERGFVASNDGNISIRVGENAVWMTPTGVSKGSLRPDMLIKLDLDGNILDGKGSKSSESAMHLCIYRENPAVRSVTHAHPPYATAFAIAGIPLDQPIYPEALVLLGTVPVAPFATPGTQEVPDSILPYCREYRGVLLANHGPVTWGRDADEAYYRLESLENYARVTLYSRFLLGKANALHPEQVLRVLEAAGPKAPGPDGKERTDL